MSLNLVHYSIRNICLHKMFEVESILLLSAFGLLALMFYKWATQNSDFFVKRGVKHLKPTLIFGNTAEFFFQRIGIYEFVDKLYNSFPSEKYIIHYDSTVQYNDDT